MSNSRILVQPVGGIALGLVLRYGVDIGGV